MSENYPLLPLSYSKLSNYISCPYRCKYEKQQDTAAKSVGGIFHDCMKLFHLGRGSEVNEKINKEIVLNSLKREDVDELKRMYQETISNARMDVPSERIVTVESDDGDEELYGKKFFLVPLPLIVECADGVKRRVAIRGAFDLVFWNELFENGITVRDYKTGFLEADDFQADLYALAAYLKYWRVMPIFTQFVYPRKGFAARPVKYTESELVLVLEYVSIVASAYAKEKDWKPKFNEMCGTCSLRNGCNVYLDKISKIPEAQEIDPENWAAIQVWKEQMSALAKVSKKFLDDVSEKEKDYIRKYGPQIIGNGTKEVGVYEEVARYDIPTAPVSSILQNAGIDPTPALSFSSGKLDVLMSDAEIKGIISKATRIKLTNEIDNLKSISSSKFVVRAKPIKK